MFCTTLLTLAFSDSGLERAHRLRCCLILLNTRHRSELFHLTTFFCCGCRYRQRAASALPTQWPTILRLATVLPGGDVGGRSDEHVAVLQVLPSSKPNQP